MFIMVMVMMVNGQPTCSFRVRRNLSNCHHGIALLFQSGPKVVKKEQHTQNYAKLIVIVYHLGHCHHGHGLPSLTVGFQVIIQMTEQIHPASALRASRL